jgi:nicotinamide riboside kinase
MLETAIAVARVNAELEAATADSILLCDRTVLAGLAYLTDIDPSDEPLAQDLRAFLVAYAERTYDIIVVVDRAFAPRHDRPRDPLLPEDRHAQAEYQVRIRILLESTSIPLLRVAEYEESWSTALRVAHELDARGLLT